MTREEWGQVRWALDPYSGKIVDALDRRVTRRDYRCPRCNAVVRLRRGHNRRPHFAHASNQADPECELYIPAAVSGLPEGTRRPSQPYRSLALYLRTLEEQDGVIRWFLELGIPEPDVGCIEGQIHIPFGFEGERIIPVRSIRQGGIRVRVKPDYQYRLGLEGVADSDWARRCSETIDGLSKRGVTVFQYSPSGGRMASRAQPLYWGRSYAVIWETSLKPSWWPRASALARRDMVNRGSWGGSLISLPAIPDRQVESWARQCLDRRVERPPVEVRLLSPPAERRLDDGSLVVSAGSRVIIGLFGEAGSLTWSQVQASCDSGLTFQALREDDHLPVIFSLGVLSEGRTDIWVDDDIDNSLHLVVTGESSSRQIPRATVCGRDRNEVEWSVPLDQEYGAKFLFGIRDNEFTLTAIRCPAPVPVYLKWRAGAGENWNTYVGDPDLNTSSLPEDFLSTIRCVLTEAKTEVVLDAGPFGYVFLEDVERKPRVVAVSMSHPWRQKVLWLLSQLAGQPVYYAYSRFETFLDYLSSGDQQLVRQLLRYRWPVRLTPQIKSVLAELETEVQRAYRNSTSPG